MEDVKEKEFASEIYDNANLLKSLNPKELSNSMKKTSEIAGARFPVQAPNAGRKCRAAACKNSREIAAGCAANQMTHEKAAKVAKVGSGGEQIGTPSSQESKAPNPSIPDVSPFA